MRVLQINSSVNTSSTGRIAEQIGKTLQKNGHESFIAYNITGPEGSNSNLIQVGTNLDFYLHVLKTRLFDLHGFGSTRATSKFVTQIKEINPDVIGIHNLHGYYLNIEVLFNYLKEVQKPVIWTFHDCWPFTGHCSYFDHVSCNKWKTECHDCPLSNRYPASWFLDNSRENFRYKNELFNGLDNLIIVTPSQWLKDLVHQSFLSDYPVKVINNGIDLEQFKPVLTKEVISKYGLEGKKILLGVASVWDRRKGLDYFIELSEHLDDSYRIILIGLSQEKIYGLPNKIIGIKRTENLDQLVSFYSTADIFINPTLVDNFPTTNIEALACGTPVITFDTGGSAEAIDKHTGVTIEKGNIEQLLEAIDDILNEDPQKYLKNCRERAVSLYNNKERFSDYIAIYENLLNSI